MNETQAKGTAVLVVEDNREMLQEICEGLRTRGYRVEGVTSGHEALARLRRAEFTAVVADIDLVRTYNLDLIREVQRVEGFRPWVLYTGTPDPMAPRWCRQAGVFCVVVRGAPKKDLLRSVEAVCRSVSWMGRLRCA